MDPRGDQVYVTSRPAAASVERAQGLSLVEGPGDRRSPEGELRLVLRVERDRLHVLTVLQRGLLDVGGKARNPGVNLRHTGRQRREQCDALFIRRHRHGRVAIEREDRHRRRRHGNVRLIDDEQPKSRRSASLRRGRHWKQGGGQEQERGECTVNTHIYLYGRSTRTAFKSMQTSC